ncbi:MAG: magnesium transporter [Alphaproteobacteria bacterium]|nr:MAG: magnesium transporter [Alphaproteobacteria bacterium]
MTEQPATAIAEDTPPVEALHENGLRPEFVREVMAAIDAGDEARVRDLALELHSADLADLIEQVGGDYRHALVRMLGADFDAEVLSELDVAVREELLESLAPVTLAKAVSELETDDAVDILEDLEDDQQREVLAAIPEADRRVIVEALSYPEDSAGRLMQRDLIAVPEFWTVGQTIDYLRENQDLTTEFWEIFVVDPAYKPVGTLRLSAVLRTPRATPVKDIMQVEQTLIPVDMDQEQVAFRFQQYHLISAAVVDADGRLVGQITVDDIVDVINEEAGEDILALAGVSEGDFSESVITTTRSRLTWLIANLITAILASLVIWAFDQSIEKLVALAILMPIVASMGGNAGTQTMTVTVRALATNQLTGANAMRILSREIKVSLINGLLFAILMGGLAGLWFQNALLGAVLGVAMIVNLLAAGLSGMLVPLALERLKIDPAVASSVFVTTVTDVVGFFAFLGLAAYWLL